jgi:hypothetical protein
MQNYKENKMCGYDPFKYADNYESEEELLKELEMEKEIINIDIDAITEKIDELKKLRHIISLS